MSSSGTGTSFNDSFKACMQLGYLHHVRGMRKRGETFAPPLVVGEAAHKYAETIFKGWIAGLTSKPEMLREEAEAQFDAIVKPYYDQAAGDDLLYAKLNKRVTSARNVLRIWRDLQWARLEAHVDIPIAAEKDILVEFPAETRYGPIAPHLRPFTGRIDLVVERRDGLDAVTRLGVTIRDIKTSSANDLKGMLANHYRSDQHLGYAFGWNLEHPYVPDNQCTQVEYEGMRFADCAINDKSFCNLRRPVRQSQLDNWYERTMALRARLSRMWPEPTVFDVREAWEQNNTNTGPCENFWGKCEFWDLCENPGDTDAIGPVGSGAPFEEHGPVLA